jgi:hypothetical protein
MLSIMGSLALLLTLLCVTCPCVGVCGRIKGIGVSVRGVAVGLFCISGGVFRGRVFGIIRVKYVHGAVMQIC